MNKVTKPTPAKSFRAKLGKKIIALPKANENYTIKKGLHW
jgi:hypothetical protein